MNHLFVHVIATIIFFGFAAFFIYVPLKTLLTRRPVIYPARYAFIAMCFMAFPIVAYALMSFDSGQPSGFSNLASPLFFLMVLVIFWFQMRGYMIIGVTNSYFREALLAATNSSGLTTEENISRIKITETGDEFEVAIHGWIGTAQMKPVNKPSEPAIAQITKQMNVYFQSHNGRMNYAGAYLGVFAGLMMFAVIISMLFWLWTLS